MAELTPKQQKFCENVAVKKMTYSAAYRDAYGANEWKTESVNVEACKLMAQPSILLRVEELQKKREEAVIKEAVYDYKAHMKELDEILAKAKELTEDNPNSLNTALKASELKGKVSELYNFVQKTEFTEVPSINVDIPKGKK